MHFTSDSYTAVRGCGRILTRKYKTDMVLVHNVHLLDDEMIDHMLFKLQKNRKFIAET